MRIYNFDDVKVGNSVIVVHKSKQLPPARYDVGSIKYPNSKYFSDRELIGLEKRDKTPHVNGNQYYWVRLNDDIMVFD